MSKKNFNIYACRITVDVANENKSLLGNDLRKFLEMIRTLPIDLSLGQNSRYKKDSTCLIFIDELKGNFIINNDFLPAIYIKRRDNKPLEDDGHGNLLEVTLSSDENQIAEVSYVIFSFSKGIAYWINNPLVSGTSSFAEYLNFTYRKACDIQNQENIFLPDISQVVFSYIKYPHSETDYAKESFLPISLDFNLALGAEDLQQKLLFGSSDGDAINLLRHFSKNSNCGKIRIEISASPSKKKKDKESSRPYLNKKFISDFFESVKGYLDKSERNKFSVRGIDIDEDTRILDLINGKLIHSLSVEYNEPSVSVTEVLSQFMSYVKTINASVESYI